MLLLLGISLKTDGVKTWKDFLSEKKIQKAQLFHKLRTHVLT